MKRTLTQTFPLLDTEQLPIVTLTTDGACVPNPGPGSWAFILRAPGSARVLEKADLMPDNPTTNNRAEMQAVIEGLRALTRRARVTIRTDSEINVGAINGTGKKAYKRANQDLVQALLVECRKHIVRAVWVKGHAGDPDNERCDQLCAEALRRGASCF
jgi:ribonuclease HI